jgi:sulfatase maturation enzyme AslB (radical SAM superfamily)
MIKALRFGSRILSSGKPYKLNLYLTDRCNCRCKICGIWKKKKGLELSVAEIRDFLGKNPYFFWVDVTGGEIFMRKDIDEVFDAIVECKNLYLLHFPTNGLMTEKICESVRRIKKKFSGRLVITVSIDGTEVLHDSLRGARGSWRHAIQTFRKLDAINNGNVFFGYTLSKYNAGRLLEAYDELRGEIPDLDLHRIHLNLAQNSNFYYANTGKKLLVNRDEILKDIEFINHNRAMSLNPFNILEHRFLELLGAYISSGDYPLKQCMALNDTVTVNPKGEVYACLFFDRKLGDLHKTNFYLQPIMDTAMQLRQNILKECPHCWSACEAYPTIIGSMLK